MCGPGDGGHGCTAAVAHHSFAVFFDNEQGIVTVKGVVTEFSFRNPMA